jgi:hypothetical protein
MSNPMPWITFVVPKDFSMFANDTEAMRHSKVFSSSPRPR